MRGGAAGLRVGVAALEYASESMRAQVGRCLRVLLGVAVTLHSPAPRLQRQRGGVMKVSYGNACCSLFFFRSTSWASHPG